MRAHVTRSLEAFRRINARRISECHNHADSRYCHQTPTGRVPSCKLDAQTVEAFKRFNNGTSRAKERLHNRNQALIACNEFKDTIFEALLRDGTDPEPEHFQRPPNAILDVL